MKCLKVLLIFSLIALGTTPCYAEGQNGMNGFFALALTIIAMGFAVLGGIVIRGLFWLMKFKVEDTTCFVISGVTALGFLIVNLLSQNII